MDHQIDRIQFLLSQQRYQLAEQEARKLIAEYPDQGLGHTMLAWCLSLADRDYKEATKEAEQGIALDPEEPFGFYVLSNCLLDRKRYKDALSAIKQAIEMDPYDEVYFALQAEIYMLLQKWNLALESAESGLQIDPEDERCNNVRSISLERLGRGQDAVDSARENLKNSPDSSYSHAALGWTLLNKRQYQEAQESFRESLRLNPNNEMAREGMISALQGASPLYRLIHRYEIFMSRLGTKYQFAIVIGLWLTVQISTRIAGAFGGLASLVVPLVILFYLGFAVLTWTSDSIHNALLRFHPMGRHLLTPLQVIQSNFVVTCLACSFFGLMYGTVAGGLLVGIGVSLYWVLMILVATEPFDMPTPKMKWISALVGIAIGLYPPITILFSFMTDNPDAMSSMMQYFSWSMLIYQIVCSVLSTRTPAE